jgi:hypothetical protein
VARGVAPVPQAVVPIQQAPVRAVRVVIAAVQAVMAVVQAAAVAQGAGPVAHLAARAVVQVERGQKFPPMDTVRVTTPVPPIAKWTRILIHGSRALGRGITGSEVD